MSGFDRWIVIFNMFGAFVALGCNLWAATRGSPHMRPVRVGVAAFAGIYVIAYGWLAVFEDTPAWSRVMRGVSLGVWPMVWCAPAIIGAHVTRRTIEQLEQLEP